MHAVMVQFTCDDPLSDLSWFLADPVSELHVADGLVSTTWFADDDVRGGLLVFVDEAAAEACLCSAAFDAIVLNPTFARLRIHRLDVIDHCPMHSRRCVMHGCTPTP